MTPDIVVEPIDLDDEVLAPLAQLLPESELAQAARFNYPRDRRRFLARRGLLRRLLAQRLNCRPREIAFERNPFGKLSLPGSKLRFNLAHSRGVALFVLAEDREIGCDIERRDPDLATQGLVDHLFSAHERAALGALSAEDWLAGFYNCWTRKEAFMKAMGKGFSLSPQSFDVSLLPAEAPRLLSGGSGWKMRAWMAGDFHLAIVYEASSGASGHPSDTP